MTIELAGVVEVLDRAATPHALAVTVPYVLALTAVLAEVAWSATRAACHRAALLRSLRTGLTMAAGATVVGVGYTAVLGVAWAVAAPVRLDALSSLWHAQPVLGGLACFVAWDAAGYWYHRIGHTTRVGWAAHSPHHTGARFDLTLGLRQTWFPIHGLAVHPLLALAGFDLAAVAVCAAVSGCLQVLQHASFDVPVPRFVDALVMTPGTHRHHHASGAAGGAVNLGPVLTVWDRLGGTWAPASSPDRRLSPSAQLGPAVDGALAAELHGWRSLRRSMRRPLPV